MKMQQCTIKVMYDLNRTIAAGLFEGLTYPWEALPKIKDYILTLGPTLDPGSLKKEERISGWRSLQRWLPAHA